MGFFGKLKFCMKKVDGMKTTILARIFRLAFLSTFVVSIGILLVSSIGTSTLFEEKYEEDIKNYTKIYSSSIAQWNSLIRNQIETEAKNSSFIDESLSLEERKALLASAAEASEFKDFSIAYSDGNTYNDTNISERDYYKNAVNGTTYISSPIVRKTDGKLTIMVGSKMKDSDKVIYGGVDVDFFSDMVANINLGNTGIGYIVDANGTIIAHPDEQLVIDQVNPVEIAKTDATYTAWAEEIEEMQSGKSEVCKFVMPDGKKYLIGYCPIEGPEGWTMVIMIENAEVTNSSSTLFYQISAIVYAAILVILFIAVRVSVNIAYPIKSAIKVLMNISEGDLSELDENLKGHKDETEVLINALRNTRNQLYLYISEIGTTLNGIANGNLDQEIDNEYKGDFVSIKDSLNSILSSLNRTFARTSEASANLLEGARQVEMASQALASASTEQASAVVQITASIEGIAKSTDENTKDVIKVDSLTQNAKNEAATGNAEMHKMIEAMDDISASSQNIAKIMKVIDDISFQTNILALNASVEAARAGIHGRGFAVVAEEVRTLAGKSSEAATEIADMIDDTIKKINIGSNIASSTAEDLEKIVKDIDEIAEVMSHIADMSREQAVSVEQVNTGIEQISSVVQNNSATSEECAASSVELAEQADSLRKQIAYFKLR